ncbi:hypothetical protein SASPL_105104 [Salvia splendens]|uniref:Uncharacterized protein n=1 Tax=Salvia splendens TaxID=180675 RepID=A0A8X8YP02_SALSN|nr:hypothetical protein SASPL_105104 [Salvia splendens]
MALQKRLEYGFDGYQVPPTPRAAGSVRVKLLLEGERSPSGTEQPPRLGNAVEKEDKYKDKGKSLEENPCDSDCYERNFLFTEIVSEAPNPNSRSNELACVQNVITSSDCSVKFGCVANDDCKISVCSSVHPDRKSSAILCSIKFPFCMDRDSKTSFVHLQKDATISTQRMVLSAKGLSGIILAKKRKLFNCSSASNSDESITGDEMFENGVNEGRLKKVPITQRGIEDQRHYTVLQHMVMEADKWKTLVHTAGISPQPVPQELLDRVLTAHAYWSQQQQQQLESQPDTCLLL